MIDKLMKKTTWSIGRVNKIESRLNNHQERLDKVEEILDVDDKSISPYSKAFMEDILKKCRTEGADGVEIIIYKIGSRTEAYNYDKK